MEPTHRFLFYHGAPKREPCIWNLCSIVVRLLEVAPGADRGSSIPMGCVQYSHECNCNSNCINKDTPRVKATQQPPPPRRLLPLPLPLLLLLLLLLPKEAENCSRRHHAHAGHCHDIMHAPVLAEDGGAGGVAPKSLQSSFS